MRKETFLAVGEETELTFHCVSRVVDRAFKFGEKEKAVFVKMMREYEAFCGVEVLTYCVMSNHVHFLVRVPKASERDVEVADDVFIARLSKLYKKEAVLQLDASLKRCRKNHANKAARELKQRYSYRMGDISEFMKSLKQKFSRWYNKANARTGTLWEDRYSVTMVGAGWATKVVAAYIDLNPLRAGMVADPAEYKWSGYGEAVAKGGLAKKRLHSVMTGCEGGASLGSHKAGNAAEAMHQYRMIIAEEGREESTEGSPLPGQKKSIMAKRKKGFSKEELERVLESGGKLSLAQLLRCKTRYFTAGFAIGSEVFVERMLEDIQVKTGQYTERRAKASRVRHGENATDGLFCFRKLQKCTVEGSET